VQPRHVLDWSSARVEWTAAGFELTVSLQPGSSVRLVNAVSDALENQLTTRYRDLEILAYEPDGEDAAAIGVVSSALLDLDPQRLRVEVDTIADAAANAVLAQSTTDDAAIAAWLSGLRG
jgi:hypothetical protein